MSGVDMASMDTATTLPPNTTLVAATLVTAIWSITAISVTVVILRVYTSAVFVRKLSLPDYLMVLAMIFGIIGVAFVTIAVHFGLGRHVYYISPQNLSNVMKYQTISLPFSIFTATTGRVSLAVYLLRLVDQSKLKRWALYFCMAFTVFVNGFCVILVLTQCGIDISTLWRATRAADCSGAAMRVPVRFGYFQGTANALVDLILTIIPTWLVYKLTLTLGIKLGAIVLLLISLFVAIASIVRTALLAHTFRSDKDITYNLVGSIIWTALEGNIVIIAASVPLIRPLFRKKRETQGTRLGSSTSSTRSFKKEGY